MAGFRFVLALALVFALSQAAFAADKKPVASPGVGGAFSLVDGDGNNVTEKSWPGKFKLVFFGFTSCPEICPVALDKIATALNKMDAADVARIQPLFITTDPARDKPEVVKAFVANFHKSIIGLTGTEAQIKAAEDTYKVYAVKSGSGKDYQIDHSGYIYFMSADDKMLAILGSSSSADDIAAKIKMQMD